MNLLLVPSIIAGTTELFPSFGLSIFPDRNEAWDSKHQQSTEKYRIVVAILVWTLLFVGFLMETDQQVLDFAVLMVAVLFVWTSFALMRTQKHGTVSSLLYFTAWVLILYSLRDNSNFYVLVALVVGIMLGAKLISQGRWGKKGVDYAGRVVFAGSFISFAAII